MDQFATHGSESASTRQIATAGVHARRCRTTSSQGRESTWRASSTSSRSSGATTDQASARRGAGRSRRDDRTLIERYLDILGVFLSFILETPQSADWRRFMACEQAGLGPPSAATLMEQGLNQRLSHVTRSIVGRLTGRPTNDEATIIRTMALNSQSIVFRVKRAPVLRALGWDTIDQQRMETVRNVMLS